MCIVHSRPAAQVVWSKDGRPIDEPGQVVEHNKGHRHSLQINDVTEDDFGKYECEADNELGSVIASIHLTGKREKIILHLFIYSIYFSQGITHLFFMAYYQHFIIDENIS